MPELVIEREIPGAGHSPNPLQCGNTRGSASSRPIAYRAW